MPAIHIRDIPDGVLEALKRRAAANHRSLQKELRQILVLAAQAPAGLPRNLTLKLVQAPAVASNWGRDEIYQDDDGR